MDWGVKEKSILILLLVNLICVVAYLVWGLILYPKKKREKDSLEQYSRIKFIINGTVMLICPVVGIGYFTIGQLFYYIMARNAVDLEDVIFSKERVVSYMKADEERDRNIVPLEEAIAISDKDNLRMLMLNIVKGNVKNSLSTISQALNSEDSETAHYAASVLRDELNEVRSTIQHLENVVKSQEDDFVKNASILIEYMNDVLVQKVFTNMEQEAFVKVLDEICELFYQKEKEHMECTYFEWVSLRLLEIKEFELTKKWCDRGMQEFPDELSSYTCKLKYYFTLQDKENFFTTMNELKSTFIVIDSETLELIRIFQ